MNTMTNKGFAVKVAGIVEMRRAGGGGQQQGNQMSDIVLDPTFSAGDRSGRRTLGALFCRSDTRR